MVPIPSLTFSDSGPMVGPTISQSFGLAPMGSPLRPKIDATAGLLIAAAVVLVAALVLRKRG